MNWTHAESYCVNYLNSHLASFENASDAGSYITLRDNLGISSEVLIGLYSDSETNGKWEYTDGSILNDTYYNNWHPGQPDLSDSVCSLVCN